MKKTIYVVDDSITNLEIATEVLEDDYRVITMNSAARMFATLEKVVPDLILLDIEMPEMNGMDALLLLKQNKRHATIPVVFLTSYNNAETETLGFENGAVDFVFKPFTPSVLKLRIKSHLDIDEIVRNRTRELNERTLQLEKLKNDIVYVLSDLVENRDKSTGGHVGRVSDYMKILLEAMVKREVYTDEIKDWDIDAVCASSRMHDVGKITISDYILNKPGKLTREEFEIMQGHVDEGIKIIKSMAERTGNVEFLRHALKFTAFHHENWNGTGYPRKLKGEYIPLHGRIMAIIDVYDALTSKRSYKPAFTNEAAVDIIMKDSGVKFDPKIADVFYAEREAFKEARESFSEDMEQG